MIPWVLTEIFIAGCLLAIVGLNALSGHTNTVCPTNADGYKGNIKGKVNREEDVVGG